MSSFSVSLVSLGVTSWLRIVFLFLDFHIDHTVIEIRYSVVSQRGALDLSLVSANDLNGSNNPACLLDHLMENELPHPNFFIFYFLFWWERGEVHHAP